VKSQVFTGSLVQRLRGLKRDCLGAAQRSIRVTRQARALRAPETHDRAWQIERAGRRYFAGMNSGLEGAVQITSPRSL